MRDDEDVMRSVYHECGHVVMAELLGGTTELLTIAPEEDEDLPERSGEFRVRWEQGGASDREMALKEIKVALAGPVVEMIYEGTQVEPEYLEEWKWDWELAVSRAREYLPKTRSVSEHLGEIVYDLIAFFEREDVWATVAALADALEAHEFLEREEIEEVLKAWPVGGA